MFLWLIMGYEITSSSNRSWVLREEVRRRRCLGVFDDKNSSSGREGVFLTTKTPPPENMNVFDYKNSFLIAMPCFCWQKLKMIHSNLLVRKLPLLIFFAFLLPHENMIWCFQKNPRPLFHWILFRCFYVIYGITEFECFWLWKQHLHTPCFRWQKLWWSTWFNKWTSFHI